MEIVVCIKQVPDTTEVKFDPNTNTLIRQGVPSIVNPFDKNAVEAALQLREAYGGKVTVLSMGPIQAKDALKECLAMGADSAILINDQVFSAADALATSYTLAAAICKIGSYDIILCGKQAIDGETSLVGSEIAERLQIAQVTYASKIEIEGNVAKIEREHEEGCQFIESTLPALVTVIRTSNYEPRFPTVKGTMKANRTEIAVWTASDLDVKEEQIGYKGSSARVCKISSPPRRLQGVLIQEETAREAVSTLLAKLADAKII